MTTSSCIDTAAIEQAVRSIIVALHDDPEREGLRGTPARVARMYEEVFEGQLLSNHEIAKQCGVCFSSPSDAMVIERNIPVFSFCEHHLALMYDMQVSIAYIPEGRVLGLSKMARIAELCARRLQLQERLTQDIWDVMYEILGVESIAVFVSGKHSCMTARGIKKPDAVTTTHVLGGRFRTDQALRSEVMARLYI